MLGRESTYDVSVLFGVEQSIHFLQLFAPTKFVSLSEYMLSGSPLLAANAAMNSSEVKSLTTSRCTAFIDMHTNTHIYIYTFTHARLFSFFYKKGTTKIYSSVGEWYRLTYTRRWEISHSIFRGTKIDSEATDTFTDDLSYLAFTIYYPKFLPNSM